MFSPRILAGPPLPIRGLGLEVSGREWAPAPSYDLLVNSAWQRIREQQSVWDGVYYRALDPAELERGRLRLGLVRYRYIATFPALHEQFARSGSEPLHHLSTIALIRTIDGHYLFGRRARTLAIDLIGGGVQQDELAITTAQDLEHNLYKEIREETGIVREHVQELAGRGALLSSTSNVLLLAQIQLRISRTDALQLFARRTENEMSEPVFVAEKNLRRYLQILSDYRGLLPNLL